MSQENVEVVRECFACLNRGDIDTLIELCDEDFRIDMSERVFNPDNYLGHAGIRRFYDGVTDAWESYHWELEDARVVGDTVVALLHCMGQSREGGPGVDWRVAWLWKLREGKAESLRFYRDRAKALEAAGLSE